MGKSKVFYERTSKTGELTLDNGFRATKVACPSKGKKQRRGEF